ncbi:hypothetical protein JOM56_009504 [Amanita muscaria]
MKLNCFPKIFSPVLVLVLVITVSRRSFGPFRPWSSGPRRGQGDGHRGWHRQEEGGGGQKFMKFVKTLNKSATNQFGVVQSSESKWRQRGRTFPRPHIPVNQIQVVSNMIDTNQHRTLVGSTDIRLDNSGILWRWTTWTIQGPIAYVVRQNVPPLIDFPGNPQDLKSPNLITWSRFSLNNWAPITKKNFKTILLNIVPASVALTERAIEGLALMDENAEPVSVLKTPAKLKEAAESLNVEQELAHSLMRAIAEFRERLVPLFKERKAQTEQIDKLQFQLEESTAKLRSFEDKARANRKNHMEVASERAKVLGISTGAATNKLTHSHDKNEALKEHLAALEKQIDTLIDPFWTARLVALALLLASAIFNVGLGLNAAVKAKLANQMNNKMSPFIASLVTFSEQDRKAPIRIDVNTQDIAKAGAAVTSVSAFIAVSCALMIFLHLRGSLSPLTPRRQGAFLVFCGALLFAPLVSYTLVYQSRSANVAVSVFSIRVPENIVQIAQSGLGIQSKYSQIDFLRLMAILPWFTVLFSLTTAGMLLVARRQL